MGKHANPPNGPVVLAATSLLLFIISALSGLMVAYAWTMAFEKFLALTLGIVVALGLVFIGRFGTRLVILFALAFVAVTLGTNVLQTYMQPSPMTSMVDHLVEPLIICLPLLFALVVNTLHGEGYGSSRFPSLNLHSNISAFESIGLTLLLMFAAFLIGSGDISSGLALMTGMVVAGWLVAQSRFADGHPLPHTINRILAGITLVVLTVYIWVVTSPTAYTTLGAWLPATIASRLHRYHDFLDLAADYPFTGSGLAVSEMVYSSYLFIVQVPFTAQAHNLFLQLAVEQGVPGLVGLTGLLVATLWVLRQVLVKTRLADNPEQARIFYLAAATAGAVVTFIVNGMLDADIYNTSLVALLFVPIATAWGLFIAQQRNIHYTRAHHYVPNVAMGWSILIGFTPLLLMIALFFSLGGTAAAYANAGAVAQTQAELSIYDWQLWSMQDQIRRTNPEQLYPAEQSFNAAIALNPYNVTAHWRLGQIELAQGDYTTAEEHLAQAYRMAPYHRAVRQLLGELYATQGKIDQAVQLWQPLDVGQNQLQLRQSWYEIIGDSSRALNFQEALLTYEQSSCCSQ